MSQLTIRHWRAAMALARHFGPAASDVAISRAVASLQRGDHGWARRWLYLAEAILEMEASPGNKDQLLN